MNGDVLSLASREGVDKGKDPGGRGVAGVEGHVFDAGAGLREQSREECGGQRAVRGGAWSRGAPRGWGGNERAGG